MGLYRICVHGFVSKQVCGVEFRVRFVVSFFEKRRTAIERTAIGIDNGETAARL